MTNKEIPLGQNPIAQQSNTSLSNNAVGASIEQQHKNIDDLLEYAGNMWKQLKTVIKEKPEFRDMDDKIKLNFFTTSLKHDEFIKEFPIVSRYMICMGQYSSRAFRLFLEKVRFSLNNMPPPEQRPKGYVEDEWIKRQADYVKFLWKEYQKKGPNNDNMARLVWEDAYKKLRGELDDFKDKYDEVKKSTEDTKKRLHVSNVKDLLGRLASGEQSADTADEKKLLTNIRNIAYKSRFNRLMKELVTKREQTPAEFEADGTGQAEEPFDKESQPVIKMIEHIDDERMGEVPASLIATEDDFRP